MKKTLLILAAAMTCTGAFAADVSIYGKVDTAVRFGSTDSGVAGTSRDNQLYMASGTTAGSRWGLKGTEDLGNGSKVGFVLESGFGSDTGKLNSLPGDDRLFSREAIVFVEGAYGRLAFGRQGGVNGGNGSLGLFGGNLSVFGPAWDEVGGHRFIWSGAFGQMDNVVSYSTPSFGPFKVHFQYSFGTDYKSEGTEGESSVDRFYAMALQYKTATTEWNTALDSTNFASSGSHVTNHEDDSLVLSTGVKHDVGFMKVSGGVQIFRKARDFSQVEYQNLDRTTSWLHNGSKDGYGMYFGTEFSFVPSGVAKIGVGYMHAEKSDRSTDKTEFNRFNLGVGYWHRLSKRTGLYGGVGYTLDELDGKADADHYGAAVGISHNF